MRIRHVSVKKLFGIFNHEIPLNMESRITIIHAPNGFGKTVLMRMIDGLFTSKYKIFSDVPFEQFNVFLESGERICVTPDSPDRETQVADPESDDDESDQAASDFEILYFENQSCEPESYRPRFSRAQRMRLRRMVEATPELERVGRDRWLNMKTGTYLTFEGAIESFGLQARLSKEFDPPWLIRMKENVHTRFVQAERLRSQRPSEPFRPYFTDRSAPIAPEYTVEEFSNEIVKNIGETTDEYAELSQAIDRSFPSRVIGEGGIREFDEDLDDRLNKLEDKRQSLMSLGLLEKEEDAPDISRLRSPHESVDNIERDLARVFFSTYVQDIEDKLSAFDNISEKLRILTRILNKRFQYKTLKVDKKEGFVIEADNKNPIQIASLSSGEQHELVLLYQLLFHVERDSLILIDEPELSLHVVWQRRFLEDLETIIGVGGFDVLVATHSPQIIHDKWDWMVDMHNPDGEFNDETE